MAKAFAFELGQRVNVPSWHGAQGMVALPTGQSIYVGTVEPGEHLFYVTWIDERGQPIDGWFSESELLKANLQPDVVDDVLQAIENNPAWGQTDTAAGNTTITLGRKQKRKPARKSKSKKRK